MNKNNYWDRFHHFKKSIWILIAALAAMLILGLYFSIAMSVKLSQGYTLFGDSNSLANDLETTGPTQADIMVISLLWILTVLDLGLLVFYVFFRKEETSSVVKKEIVNGRTVIIKDDSEEDKSNHAGK
ncbi:MAG: hypothetical protein WCR56_03060 [Bacilli bacterium]|jgi:flagellar basal body-associated protein FliL